MTPAELKRQRWQYLTPYGVRRDDAPTLYVVGINGGSEYLTGLTINGNTIERLPGETFADLVARVRTAPDIRGEATNIATCTYDPHVDPKPVRQTQPRFQYENARW